MNGPDASPGPRDLARLWPLDPSVDYLNHGSFGACPRAVLDAQTALREEMEQEPVDFLWRKLPRLLGEAREALAAFLCADPEGLAFVPNATAGVNAVLRSLDIAPGDELLTTDHAYGACLKALAYVASRTGARVVVAAVPFPIRGEDEVVGPLLGAVTPRTRLVLLDHVTSPTALVFPAGRVVAEMAERGVDVLVDGAHAPGMVPLDLDRLGAAYYTGNAHKWLCAPKGAAFLHVRADRRRRVHPVSISHGYEPGGVGARFREEFDWTGTDDPTAYLAVPASLRYLESIVPGGWPAVMARNRTLALSARAILCEALSAPEPCPASMVGSIASVPLPAPASGSPADGLDADALAGWFRERGVETWIYPWPPPGGRVVRASAQLYNEAAQYERLARLLREALGLG